MESIDISKEIQTLCDELEKLGGFECCNKYYGGTLDGEDNYIGFDVYYLDECVFRIKIEGQTCIEIYNDKKTLNELHSIIAKKIKQWKMNNKMVKLMEDF